MPTRLVGTAVRSGCSRRCWSTRPRRPPSRCRRALRKPTISSMAEGTAGRSVAVVGAGIGGLPAGITLARVGLDVQVYEQASQFARVGAGIQMLPNPMKVLRRLGLESHLRDVAFAPVPHLDRDW